MVSRRLTETAAHLGAAEKGAGPVLERAEDRTGGC
jgi:hypothetical protein